MQYILKGIIQYVFKPLVESPLTTGPLPFLISILNWKTNPDYV